MKRISRAVRATVAIGVALLLPCAAAADVLRIAAAGASKHALESLAPVFEAQTGHRWQAVFDTVGAMRDRVLNGEGFDIVLLSDAAIAQLRTAGKLASAPALPVGAVQVGVAVPRGAPLPDLSTPESLRAALLGAASIAYADPARGATAGTHFVRVLDQLDVQPAIRQRLHVLPFGVDVVDAVAKGRFALGISQSSEIVQHPGVQYAGPLPPPYTQATRYAGALVRDTPGARELLQWLSERGEPAFRESGFAR